MPINIQQVNEQVRAGVDRMTDPEVSKALAGKTQWMPGERLDLADGRRLCESDHGIWLYEGNAVGRRVALLHPLFGWVPA